MSFPYTMIQFMVELFPVTDLSSMPEHYLKLVKLTFTITLLIWGNGKWAIYFMARWVLPNLNPLLYPLYHNHTIMLSVVVITVIPDIGLGTFQYRS